MRHEEREDESDGREGAAVLRADLHTHTTYSDGSCSPAEVAARATEAGVELLAMTDHDSLEGAEEKAAAVRAHGLIGVSGWEVSAYRKGRVHVLGYGCRAGEAYRAFSEERRACALIRAGEMIERANAKLGLSVTIGEAERFHEKKDTPLHTMHVVRAFCERLGRDVRSVYSQLFEWGKPAYSEYGRPSPGDAVNVIHACGGIAVLAHPGKIRIRKTDRFTIMDEVRELGIDGIECYHSSHTEEEAERYVKYAREHRLLVTGGSDFHADGRGRKVGFPLFTAAEDLLAALGL